MTGNYSEPTETRFNRHTTFVVPSALEHPRIRFWYWFSFALNDWGVVQIKVNNSNWELIPDINYGSNSWSNELNS